MYLNLFILFCSTGDQTQALVLALYPLSYTSDLLFYFVFEILSLANFAKPSLEVITLVPRLLKQLGWQCVPPCLTTYFTFILLLDVLCLALCSSSFTYSFTFLCLMSSFFPFPTPFYSIISLPLLLPFFIVNLLLYCLLLCPFLWLLLDTQQVAQLFGLQTTFTRAKEAR